MSVFDWFKPLDKAIDVVDELVEDKDLKNQLKAEIQTAEIGLRVLAEQSYIAELNTKTMPKIDALHKMARSIGSWINIIGGLCFLAYYSSLGNEITLETAFTVMGLSSPQAIYNYVKGRGNPTN